MNWGAIGAVADLGGAIAVVVSLVYLAVQIRDNTRSSRSATRQSIVDSIVAINMIWPQSESFTQVLADHVAGKQLPHHQALQLSGFCYAYLRCWENVHFQYRNGMLSDEDWSGFRQNVKALLQVKAFQDFWKREHKVFTEAFQSEVRRLLDEIPSTPILQDALLFERSSEPEN